MNGTSRRLPVRYIILLMGSLAVQGTDTSRLLQLAHIEPERFDDGTGMLESKEVEAWLTAAYHLTGRTDLGFEAGRLIKLNSHDRLGYAMLSCRNIEHLLTLTSRYYHLINPLFSMRYRRVGSRGEVLFSPLAAMPLRTMYFIMEAIAVSVQNQLSMLVGPDGATMEVRMGMPPPQHLARYVELLPARFHFDEGVMPSITLHFEGPLLQFPLPMASEQVVAQVEEQLAATNRRPTPHGGWGEYIAMLLRETKGQQVTLENIARRMNISARTIDRNLKKESLQFRTLSQQVRFESAQELLAQPGATVSGVAEQMGFTDAANFTRAFRKHMGETPSEFQKRSRQVREPVGDTVLQ